MGWSKRFIIAAVLFMLFTSAAIPVMPEGVTEVDPQEVLLRGDGANETTDLAVLKDSVVLSASMAIEGSPSTAAEVILADSSTTVGFAGGVGFVDPSPDLTWYYDTILTGGQLDNASTLDGQVITTTSSEFSFQLFLLDIDSTGLYSFQVAWTGSSNVTIANETYTGATLNVYNNATEEWELLGTYADDPVDHTIISDPVLAPWRYVNHTLTGEDKLIVLVVGHRGFRSNLYTDLLSVAVTTLSYPRPRIDMGPDGSVNWGFGSDEATGSLGHVAAFDDGSSEASVTFPNGGGYNDSIAILVPPGVQVDTAYVDYVAFPSEGERTGGGTDITADAGSSSEDLIISGIPLLSHSKLSSVLLTDVIKLNVTEQRQDGRGGQPKIYVGRGTFWHQSVAQTFVPGHSGPLRGVEIYIADKYGSPGNLAVEVQGTSAGDPDGNVMARAVLTEPEVVVDAWNFFPFTSLNVQSGMQYSIVIYAKDAPVANNIYYIDYNETDVYPRGQSYLAQTTSGSGPWTPSPADFAFHTLMDYPIAPQDATRLEILGFSGAMVTDRVYFNVSGFEYVGGEWSFQIDNTNPFTVTFSWSGLTKYILFAEAPSLDVGGEGTVEWVGQNVSTSAPLDITDGLQAVLDIPDWPLVTTDLFGNIYYRVPMNLSATSEGDVALRNVVVYYHGSVMTGDMAADINAKKAALDPDAEGMVRIPIEISSRTAGTINITELLIVYDRPPYSLAIEDIDIPEDGAMPDGPLYMDTVIFDDNDNNALVFTVVKEEGDENLTWNVSEINAITFSGPANWSGGARFHIEAEDTRGLTHRTNSFNVTIVSLNDPPELVGIMDMVPAFDVPALLAFGVLDVDSPIENITVTTSSPRVTVDWDNQTLVFLYPTGSIDETVEVTVSDGVNATVYDVEVTPIESNLPPEIGNLTAFVVNLDGMGLLNLTPRATDLESPQGDLVWTIEEVPEAIVAVMLTGNVLQVIPVATTAGDHVMNISVRDPDGNIVYTELTVSLASPLHHNPVILRGKDAVPALIRVEKGKNVVLNLALNDYWYDQEDHNRPDLMRWEVTSLRTNLFSVEMDNEEQRLTIRSLGPTGNGYMTLRLFDSDNIPSNLESVQVEVYEPDAGGISWLTFALAAIVLLVIVAGMMTLSKKEDKGEKKVEEPLVMDEESPKVKEVKEEVEEEKEGEPPTPSEVVMATILDLLVIHESTSLITQMSDAGDSALPEDSFDELVELSTLFAQERFEGTKVGTIKAFKHEGNEVLVGKGFNYFLVARCTGTDFNVVASEIKRSIVNIDVGLGDRLRKWYPGQKLGALEEELKGLLEGSSK
jgi:hypothetical protein